jgi:hypothetical protein
MSALKMVRNPSNFTGPLLFSRPTEEHRPTKKLQSLWFERNSKEWMSMAITMIMLAFGSVGINISFPTGPVMATSSAGFKSPEINQPANKKVWFEKISNSELQWESFLRTEYRHLQ